MTQPCPRLQNAFPASYSLPEPVGGMMVFCLRALSFAEKGRWAERLQNWGNNSRIREMQRSIAQMQ